MNASITEDVGWLHYGGDAGGTKYSPLAPIDRNNVGGLEVAWAVRTGDFGLTVGPHREDSASVQRRSMRTRFESTTLMWNGLLYVSTPTNRVLALDPATGRNLWTFDPEINLHATYVEDLTSRGVAVWADQDAPATDRCSHRVFLATVEGRLYALDAADGVPCRGFGEHGVVDLRAGVELSGRTVENSDYSVTSPPAVVRDVVVVGSAVGSTRRRDAASGVVRGYDARTAVLRWSFDPIPRTADNSAWNRWTPESARTTGGANVWSIISTDAERDMVFLPTATAAPDFYGGNRPGRNDYANSVVALRASTGEVAWSVQVVHHDLWDYDVAAQPLLITFRRKGIETPAVVVGTKTGMVFVLNRDNGVPLLPVEERRVPASDVPGEAAWPTQPFPAYTPMLHGAILTPDSAFGITDVDREFCRDWLARLRNEGIFTPPSLQGSLVWPGYWGGINWGGMAWEPARQRLVTTIMRMPMVVSLHRRGEPPTFPTGRPQGFQYLAQEGEPYGASRMPLVAPSGIPCAPPPWSSLIALDLAADSISWSRPLGTPPGLDSIPASESWGSLAFGGPLVTAGGLVFIGASQDDRFRAFDVDKGELLWEYALHAGGQASPMTYLHRGRQYVVIVAGGRAGIGTPGDWVVSFALP